MDWEIVVHVDDGWVEVVTRGTADGAGSLKMAEALTETMRGRRITRALIDHRGIDRVIGGTFDIYERPRILRFIGALLRIRIAEVIRPEHAEHFAFFETVCRNQGFQLSVFQEHEGAVEWLLG